MAAELSIDPVEIRRRNFIGAEQFPFRTATGELYDSGDYAAALDTALELVGYAQLRDRQRHLREEGRYIGIGIASYAWRASSPARGWRCPPTSISFLPDGRPPRYGSNDRAASPSGPAHALTARAWATRSPRLSKTSLASLVPISP